MRDKFEQAAYSGLKNLKSTGEATLGTLGTLGILGILGIVIGVPMGLWIYDIMDEKVLKYRTEMPYEKRNCAMAFGAASLLATGAGLLVAGVAAFSGGPALSIAIGSIVVGHALCTIGALGELGLDLYEGGKKRAEQVTETAVTNDATDVAVEKKSSGPFATHIKHL